MKFMGQVGAAMQRISVSDDTLPLCMGWVG